MSGGYGRGRGRPLAPSLSPSDVPVDTARYRTATGSRSRIVVKVATIDAAMLAALGEPSRIRIVELLRAGPRPVGEIAEALGIRQPQVSKHLRVLGGAGIVAAEPRQRRRIYRLRAEPFDALDNWVDSFEQLWNTRLDDLGDFLQTLNHERNDDGRQADR
jgi:DNA-binding transcriptional ArsR family regulator